MHTNELHFVGIALPGEIERRLLDLQKRLYDPATMLKPIHPHVTLLHPMSMLYADHQELLPQIRSRAQKFLPLSLTLHGFDHFDNRSFHIAVGRLGHDLHKLQSELVRLLPRSVQTQHYSRPFKPHVTICHSRTGELRHHSLHQAANQHLDVSLPLTVTVHKLSLFQHIGPREYVEKPL